jgi:tetratricopeptide (TPR) repeat protein
VAQDSSRRGSVSEELRKCKMKKLLTVLPLMMLLCTIACAASDKEVCDNSQAPNAEVTSACTRLIEANPRDAIAYFNRGSAFHNQSRSHDRSADRIVVDARLARRAIEDFTQAIRLQVPEWRFRAAYFDRGTSYQDIGEYGNAIADFTDLIKLDPNNAGGYGMRGRVYLHKKDYVNAKADFLKAIDVLEKKVKDQANNTEEARANATRLLQANKDYLAKVELLMKATTSAMTADEIACTRVHSSQEMIEEDIPACDRAIAATSDKKMLSDLYLSSGMMRYLRHGCRKEMQVTPLAQCDWDRAMADLEKSESPVANKIIVWIIQGRKNYK